MLAINLTSNLFIKEKNLKKKNLIIIVACLVCVCVLNVGNVMAASGGNSDNFYASSERFGYTGIVLVYATLKDAISGRNALNAEVWPQRDGAIYAVKNAPEYDADYNIIMTNWFANNGGSPSNKNEGFFQLYDENADAWQNQKASWSRDRNTFTVSAKGRNATYPSLSDPEDYARLWNAGAPSGSAEATVGTFLTYEYELVATGLEGVEDESGFITNTTNASDYRGHFCGIFRNESIEFPASNGYYVFDIQFNNISWAAENNYGYGGSTLPDEFGGKRQNGKTK